MGASVSICNLTLIAVNVALKHLGPLYYSNHLMPNDCVTFKPGQVWFTVEVRVWKNGTNDYTDAMAALPIVGLHQAIGAISGAANAGMLIEQLKEDRKVSVNSTEALERIDRLENVMKVAAVAGFVPAVAIGVAGIVVNEIDRVHPHLIASKTGVLMKKGMTINIRGGPPLTQVTVRNESQLILMDPPFNPLEIELP